MDIITSYKESIRATQEALNARVKLLNNEFTTFTAEELMAQGFTKEEAHLKLTKERVEKKKQHLVQYGLSNYINMHSLALEEDVKILRSMLSSMRYALSLLLKEQNVRVRRVEKDEMEVPFNNSWLQLQIDSTKAVEMLSVEERQALIERADEKQHLINEMTKSLTPRQKQILQLKAAQYTHKKIAEALKIPKVTVDLNVQRLRKKIIDEGWFII